MGYQHEMISLAYSIELKRLKRNLLFQLKGIRTNDSFVTRSRTFNSAAAISEQMRISLYVLSVLFLLVCPNLSTLAFRIRDEKGQQMDGHLQYTFKPIMVRISINQATEKDHFQPVSRLRLIHAID